jgi:tRNA A-37 threonylcarbamoyl transferase component Bud32
VRGGLSTRENRRAMKALQIMLPIVAVCGGLLVLSIVLARALRRRAFVEIQPRYRGLLGRMGLVRPEHFLQLSGTIISGHPDRNVQRLTLEANGERVAVFLKREHYVGPWVRLVNALAGFGLVSRSVREACVLDALERDNVGCPEWIAAGEDEHGRAFLIVREISGAVDLRTYLRDHADLPGRRRLARRLGALLAHMHDAGFDHPDLYAKHVLVRLDDAALFLLDWQRSRRQQTVGWRSRVRNLAALNATLADDVAGLRDRLACFRAYLGRDMPRSGVRRACRSVQHQTARLLRRRHIREKRQFPLPTEAQDWIALDGEALSVTSALQRLASGSFDWLALDQQPLPRGQRLIRRWLLLGNGRQTLLVRRRCQQPLAALWAWLRRRHLASPEQRQASLLLRLQRHGVPAPQVLAMGQRRALWWLESFLLTEPAPDTVPLDVWLMRQLRHPRRRGVLQQRRQVLREAGALLARLHEASCYLTAHATGCPFAVQRAHGGRLQVVLSGVEDVQPQRRANRRRANHDVQEMQRILSATGCKPAAWRRFLLGYAGTLAPIRVPVPVRGEVALARLRPRHALANSTAGFTAGPERHTDDSQPALPAYTTSVATPSPAPETLWRRLFSGVRHLLQRPEWDTFAGPDWIDRIMDTPVTDRFNKKQGRSTGRWILEAEGEPGEPKRSLTVYLKRHHQLPWWHGWLAALWPRGHWSPALQEWDHLEWARRQGVPVPDVVAAGEFIGPRGRLQSFLAVRELTGMLPLHEAIPLAAQRLDPVAFVRWKRGLVAEMARLARMLHDRRRFHKDLYLCHFYIAGDDLDHVPESWRERVYLIDLHRLAEHRWTWWLWQMKDLAQLLYSSEIPGVAVRDRLSFWRAYRECGSRPIYDRFLRYWVVLKWRRYRRHNARHKPQV